MDNSYHLHICWRYISHLNLPIDGRVKEFFYKKFTSRYPVFQIQFVYIIIGGLHCFKRTFLQEQNLKTEWENSNQLMQILLSVITADKKKFCEERYRDVRASPEISESYY